MLHRAAIPPLQNPYRTALFTTFVIPTAATAIDPEDGSDGDGGAGDDIGKLTNKLIEEVRRSATDKEAFDFWKAERAALKSFPHAYREFTDATAAHRRALASSASQAANAGAK